MRIVKNIRMPMAATANYFVASTIEQSVVLRMLAMPASLPSICYYIWYSWLLPGVTYNSITLGQ